MSADLKKSHRKPHFQVPAGACDCHMHVLGPRGRYPYSRKRTYTPRPASLAENHPRRCEAINPAFDM